MAQLWPEDRREALCAWLRANGIDPDNVPQDADLYLEPAPESDPYTGRYLHYEVFHLNSDGRRHTDERGLSAADRPHGIDLTGEILHTAVRRPGAVDIWYQPRPDGMEPMRRSFQIVGTGQPIPTHLGYDVVGSHRGTAVSPDGEWVWHVLENWCPHDDVTETTHMGSAANTTALCLGCGICLTSDGDSPWSPRF